MSDDAPGPRIENGSPKSTFVPGNRRENLFLIGLRGSGKSTVARLVAERLGWYWLDADVELERRFGCSIRAIFEAETEAGFRDRESAVLADLCRLRRHVIATGGGVVLRPENRDRLRTSGRVVWLTASPVILAARLRDDDAAADRRPGLTGAGAASALDEIAAIHALREPLYRGCADFAAATEGRLPEIIAKEVANWWNAECGFRNGQ